MACVGLADSEAGERLLYQLGAALVVPASAPAEQVAGAVLAAAAVDLSGAAKLPAVDPAEGGVEPGSQQAVGDPAESGRVVAVWGPAGAPGRTTTAMGVAGELAARGQRTLLIDADPYGGTVATLAGLLDESPGVTAACRAANAGLLDVPRLAACCREVAPDLLVLTGLSQPARWPELRASALELVLDLARHLVDVVVVDTGFCLEDDEELAYDTLAPRRNAATVTALAGADQVIAVFSADPAGIVRLARDLPRLAGVLDGSLAELTATGRLLVVGNRLRPVLPGASAADVMLATRQHAAITASHAPVRYGCC